jgi:hypothetical protein
MSRQTPPRRASGERPTRFDLSPEPTTAVPATTPARAESLGLPAARWVKKRQIAHRDRPPAKNPKTFDPAKHCGAPTNATFNGARPCMLSKGWGTDHRGAGKCRKHFGNAPGERIQAANEAAQQALDRLGRPRAVAPQRALLETVWEAAGNVAFLREQVGALGVDMTLRVAEVAQRPSDGDVEIDGELHQYHDHIVTIREDIRAIVKLYGEWTDRLTKYAKAAVDAGIAEREVHLVEQQADLLIRVIEATLASLHLTPEAHEAARQIAVSELRLVAARNPERN